MFRSVVQQAVVPLRRMPTPLIAASSARAFHASSVACMARFPVYLLDFDVDEGATEAHITRWLVREGDRIVPDQPICEAVSNGAPIIIRAPQVGFVHRIAAPPGSTARVRKSILMEVGTVPPHSLPTALLEHADIGGVTADSVSRSVLTPHPSPHRHQYDAYYNDENHHPHEHQNGRHPPPAMKDRAMQHHTKKRPFFSAIHNGAGVAGHARSIHTMAVDYGGGTSGTAQQSPQQQQQRQQRSSKVRAPPRMASVGAEAEMRAAALSEAQRAQHGERHANWQPKFEQVDYGGTPLPVQQQQHHHSRHLAREVIADAGALEASGIAGDMHVRDDVHYRADMDPEVASTIDEPMSLTGVVGNGIKGDLPHTRE